MHRCVDPSTRERPSEAESGNVCGRRRKRRWRGECLVNVYVLQKVERISVVVDMLRRNPPLGFAMFLEELKKLRVRSLMEQRRATFTV